MADLINIPSSYCFSSVVVSIDRVIGRTFSPFTLEEQSFKWPGEVMRFDLSMPPMTKRSTASEWISFGMKAKGSFNHFLIGDPSARKPQGSAGGNPIVAGPNQSGDTIITSGWTPNVSSILKAGDYIQIGVGQSAKLRIIVDDVNSDSNGNATLRIEPSLHFSPANGSQIITDNPQGVFRMVDNTWSWSVNPGPIYRMSFSAVEVIGA